MLGYTALAWALIGGICLYAGLLHLQNGLRRPFDRVHTLFGALALLMFAVTLANILLTSATTPAGYERAAWWFTITWTAVLATLPWFITLYADEPRRLPAALASGVYAVVAVINLFEPHSILLSGPAVLRYVDYPWGDHITRSATPPTIWYEYLWIAHSLMIAYLIAASVGLFWRGPRNRAWGLALSAGPFAVSLAINMLIRFKVINIPYVAAPAFLALIVVMSTVLTRETRRKHEQMRTVLDNVPAIVYLKRSDGRYAFVNRRFAQVFGLGADTRFVLGKSDDELFGPERASQNAEADRAVLSSARGVESEELVVHEGLERTYSSLRFALRDRDGSAYAICGISTDITERKLATDAARTLADSLERRVARRTLELAQLNRELESFAYSVSHDLRAPLTAVNGFADLLLREHAAKLDATGQRYLSRIREGALRMAALIQDLLGLSRVTQTTLERKPVDLATMARDAAKVLVEAEPGRVVNLVIPSSLPANGDAKLLALAFTNLLSNAWKYTSKTPVPNVEVGALVQDGETVYFVKDNGAGFNPEHADRLFRPFVRLHSDKDFPGTGIGLATVARIIARHGGRIWADGRVGAGATIYFTLPGVDDDSAPEPTYVESVNA